MTSLISIRRIGFTRSPKGPLVGGHGCSTSLAEDDQWERLRADHGLKHGGEMTLNGKEINYSMYFLALIGLVPFFWTLNIPCFAMW